MAATKKAPAKKTAKTAPKKSAAKKPVAKKSTATRGVAKKAAKPAKVVKAVKVVKVLKAVKASKVAKAPQKAAPSARGSKVAVTKAAPARASAVAVAKAPAGKLPPVARGAAPKSARAERLAARAANSMPILPLPVAPPPVIVKPMPEPSKKDLAAAHEYLLARSATRSEAPVTVNGKRLPTEGELLRMPDADYMNEQQLAFFKYRLQEMERELLQNADDTTEHLRETVVVPDPADRATIEEEHALELRTRDRERKLLKKVQQSIASIDSGDYGYCEETGEPIGVPRLLARPTATLSLEAQQRREMKQKMYGD
jgi:DnaK suppressor protein